MACLTTLGLEESIRNKWPVTFLVYIDYPSEPIRLWAGVGDLKYAGYTYKGISRLGKVPRLVESSQIAVRQSTLQLRGVDPDAEETLGEDIRNRAVNVWVAGLTATGKHVNGEAWQVVEGLADYHELKTEEGLATINLMVSEPIFSIERAQNLLFTPEWVNETFQGSGDRITGLDLMSTLENRSENWTRT